MTLSNGLYTLVSAFGLVSTGSASLVGTYSPQPSFLRSLSRKLNLGFSSITSVSFSCQGFLGSITGALKGSYSLKEKLGAYYFLTSLGSYFFGYVFLSRVGIQLSSFFSILFLRLNLLGTKAGCSYSLVFIQSFYSGAFLIYLIY